MKLRKVRDKRYRFKKHKVNNRWFIQIGQWVLWLNTDNK